MRYKVLTSFKALTIKDEVQLQAGQVITLPKGKADSLIEQRKVKPLQHIMVESYKEFCKWLKSYPVTDNEIKEATPEHYQKLHDSINEMDTCYDREDLQGFDHAMQKTKYLYLEAVNQNNLFITGHKRAYEQKT